MMGCLQEQTKRRLKEETAVQLRSKQQKLDMLRRIINAESDSGSGGSVSSTPSSLADVTSQHPPPHTTLSVPSAKSSRILPAHSESDLLNAGAEERVPYGAGFATPSRFGHQRTVAIAPLRTTVQRAVRAKSPPPVKTVRNALFLFVLCFICGM